MRGYILAVISRFVRDYYNFSKNKKILTIVLSIAIFFIFMNILFRACSPSKPLVFQQKRIPPLSVIDVNGNEWILSPIEGQLRSNLKTDMKPGPPLIVRTDIKIEARDVFLGIIVEGQASEKYVGGARKNNRWQPPPRFKIINEKGIVLASGTFKYG